MHVPVLLLTVPSGAVLGAWLSPSGLASRFSTLVSFPILLMVFALGFNFPTLPSKTLPAVPPITGHLVCPLLVLSEGLAPALFATLTFAACSPLRECTNVLSLILMPKPIVCPPITGPVKLTPGPFIGPPVELSRVPFVTVFVPVLEVLLTGSLGEFSEHSLALFSSIDVFYPGLMGMSFVRL